MSAPSELSPELKAILEQAVALGMTTERTRIARRVRAFAQSLGDRALGPDAIDALAKVIEDGTL